MLLRRTVLAMLTALPLLMACSDPASVETPALIGTWSRTPNPQRIDRDVWEFTKRGAVTYASVIDLEPYGVPSTHIFVREGQYRVSGDAIEFVWQRMTAYEGSVPPIVTELSDANLRDVRFDIDGAQLRLRYNAIGPADGVVAAEMVLQRER